jgi:Tfp pilus assembly protein PilF
MKKSIFTTLKVNSKMKKTTLTIVTAFFLIVGGLKAQSIQEGMNHLYAGRVKTAQAVFEKMLAANPNNIDALYWMGQSYLESDEIMSSRIAAAKEVYTKALQTTNGAPLIQVGMGHVELLEKKVSEARQHFETALTMTRHNKKGDNPDIETAIGRAIVDSKDGDYSYAVRLLEDASVKDSKNTETLLQLGNAYRKAGEGKGGGPAYTAYNKALQVNPNFAPASFRLSKLFESQKNWELVLKYLNEAVEKDPKFTNAYFELFYYYFYRQKFTEAQVQLEKYINSKGADLDAQDQYLYAMLCWAQKDFECATGKGESVVSALGDKTKPKVYRMLADAYFQKGDISNAKKYSDLFFLKKNPEDYASYDYELRAKLLAKTGGGADEIFKNYVEGAQLDTVLSSRIEFLSQAADYFKENKIRDKEAQIIQKIIDLKAKPTINDYFELTTAYYFGQDYTKSRDAAIIMRDKWPTQVYGYDWVYNNSRLIDTLKKDSLAVPDAMKLYDFAISDTVKYKKQIISAASFLAIYYANEVKDYTKAIDYLKKWQAADAENYENIQKNIDILQGNPVRKQTSTTQPEKGTKTTTSKPVSKTKLKTKNGQVVAKK